MRVEPDLVFGCVDLASWWVPCPAALVLKAGPYGCTCLFALIKVGDGSPFAAPLVAVVLSAISWTTGRVLGYGVSAAGRSGRGWMGSPWQTSVRPSPCRTSTRCPGEGEPGLARGADGSPVGGTSAPLSGDSVGARAHKVHISWNPGQG